MREVVAEIVDVTAHRAHRESAHQPHVDAAVVVALDDHDVGIWRVASWPSDSADRPVAR